MPIAALARTGDECPAVTMAMNAVLLCAASACPMAAAVESLLVREAAVAVIRVTTPAACDVVGNASALVYVPFGDDAIERWHALRDIAKARPAFVVIAGEHRSENWPGTKLLFEERSKLPAALTRATHRQRLPATQGAESARAVGPVFRRVLLNVSEFAVSDASVLVVGETGTGKELVAREIHHSSARADRPFVPVNCAALPESLAESHLFGHARGAFTGALTRQPGLVAEADGGTLVLDEVDALLPSVQPKLLRFLQSGEFRAVGSPRLEHARVRIVAATNRSPEQLVGQGVLRQDLLYRINTVCVRVPPLRERPEDIPELVHHFLQVYAAKYNLECTPLTEEAMAAVLAHRFPGNVRELQHVIERATILAKGRPIENEHLSLQGARSDATLLPFRQAKAHAVAEFERAYLERALAVTGGNISRAARLVGKHRRALWELLRRHKIDTQRFSDAARSVSSSSALAPAASNSQPPPATASEKLELA